MWNVQEFSELPSTQTLARDLLSAGRAHHGDVIVALHQSSGRGQYENRLWHDEPGTNLLLSVVLTDVDLRMVDLMQFITGLAVLATLRAMLQNELALFDAARLRLKWPNDVLLDDRKIAGILCEAVWSGSRLKGVVLGIGINVNQSHFDPEIAGRATSLCAALNYPLPLGRVRDELLATLQETLQRNTDREQLLSELRREFEWMTVLKNLSAALPDGTLLTDITIVGISERGALHVSDRSGVSRELEAATLNIWR